MTPKQALTEARKRWGKHAIVEDHKKPTVINGYEVSKRFRVGTVMMGMFFEVRGDGESWEAAFRNSEKHYPSRAQKAAVEAKGN